jgi:hypothetical protein
MLNPKLSHGQLRLWRTSPLWISRRTAYLATDAGARRHQRIRHPRAAQAASSGSSSRGSPLWLARGGDLAIRCQRFAEILETGDLYLRGVRSRRIKEFLLLEPLEDSEMQIAFHAGHGFHIANVGAEFEVERAGRHAGKQNLRRWHGQDELVCLGDGPKHLANLVWIGSARDRQGNDDQSGPVVAHKIGDNAGDEARIGYDDLGAIESPRFRSRGH